MYSSGISWVPSQTNFSTARMRCCRVGRVLILPGGDPVFLRLPEGTRQNDYPVDERPYHRDQDAENRTRKDQHCDTRACLADIEAVRAEAAQKEREKECSEPGLRANLVE